MMRGFREERRWGSNMEPEITWQLSKGEGGEFKSYWDTQGL